MDKMLQSADGDITISELVLRAPFHEWVSAGSYACQQLGHVHGEPFAVFLFRLSVECLPTHGNVIIDKDQWVDVCRPGSTLITA